MKEKSGVCCLFRTEAKTLSDLWIIRHISPAVGVTSLPVTVGQKNSTRAIKLTLFQMEWMKVFSQISSMAIPWRKAATQIFVVLLFHLTSVSGKAIVVSLSLIWLPVFLAVNLDSSTSAYSKWPL